MRSRRLLAQKLNRDPSIDEIATESGFTPSACRSCSTSSRTPVSLETPVGDGESLYGDLIEDTKTDAPDDQTADAAARRGARARARAAQPAHAARAHAPLRARRPAAADARGGRHGLGITRERVRQLEARALRQLRAVAPELVFYLQT